MSKTEYNYHLRSKALSTNMFNVAHSGNSAELISLEPVDNKIEDSFNQQSEVCAVSSAGSEADVVHSEKTTSLSQELRLLMKSFLMAERRLSEIKQKMWALVKNLDTEEEDISDLMEQCKIVMSDPEFAYESIKTNSTFDNTVKTRAKNRFVCLQRLVDQINEVSVKGRSNFVSLASPKLVNDSQLVKPGNKQVKVSNNNLSSAHHSLHNDNNDMQPQVSEQFLRGMADTNLLMQNNISNMPYLGQQNPTSGFIGLRPQGSYPHPSFAMEMQHGVSPNLYPPIRPLGYGISPPVSLDKFSGDVMEYLEFKRKFKKFIAEVYTDDDVRMTYLQNLCVVEADRAIRGLGGHTDRTLAYETAWRRLDERFGNHNLLVSRVREEMLNGSPIRDFNSSALNSLRDKMFECEQTYVCLGRLQELNTPEVINKLFNRLPEALKREFIPLYRRGCGGFRELRQLVDEAAADAECSLGKNMYACMNGSSTSSRQRSGGMCSRQNQPRSHVNISAVTESSGPPSKQNFKCTLCQGKHRLCNCDTFKGKTVEQRSEFVKGSNLCFNCLQVGHRVKYCLFKQNCRECGKRHNTLLHLCHNDAKSEFKVEELASTPSCDVQRDKVLMSCNACVRSPKNCERKLHKVVPIRVWLKDPEKSVFTWAYMDDGSETSLCTSSFAQKLGATLTRTNVQMHTNNAITNIQWKINDLHIFFFYLYIYPPDSQESDGGAIRRVSNYPDLLLEMPRYCCPLVI